MAVRDFEAFVRQCAATFDPNLDTSPGSPFDTQVTQRIVRRLGPDPFSMDLSTFIDARLTEAFPELATKEGDAITDLLNKPATLLWDPIVREIKRVKDNLSFKDPGRLTVEEAEALGGNLFAERRTGDFAKGPARVFFSQAQNVNISPINFVTSRSGLRYYPTETQSIRTEEMLLNVSTDGLYYFDINVIAQAAGDKYNIGPNELVSIANVSAAVRVSNLRRFQFGEDEDTAAEFLDRAKGELTERSLVTLRGISAKITNSFPEVRRLNVVGFNDPEMQRDVLKGGGLGQVIASGNTAFVDDDGEGMPFSRRLTDVLTPIGSSINEFSPGTYVVTVLEAFATGEPVAQDLTVRAVVNPFTLDFEEQVFQLGAGGIPAIGTIETVPKSDLVDGETFTLNDGVNPATTFEFDDDSSVILGNVAVNISAAVSADSVRDVIIAAINGVVAPLLITAYDAGPGVVGLRNDQSGPQGNQTILETVTDGDFDVTGMAGGSGGVPIRWVLRKRELTLSDIPGGILFPNGPNGELSIPDDEVHIGGATDIHVRGSGFEEATLVLSDVVDDEPELSGTQLTIVAGSPNTIRLGDIILDSTYTVADEEFRLLKRAGHENMSLQVLEGPDAGVYRIVSVVQASGQSPVVTTDPEPATPSVLNRRWRLFNEVNIDLVDPKETRISDEDMTSVQNSDVVSTGAGTDFDALGVVKDDTLRILEGPDAGDYNIVEDPLAPSFTSLHISQVLTSTTSSLKYTIFRGNAGGGLQLPLVRFTKVELLDSSNQPLGSEVPYAHPVDIQSRAFQNPARGIKHDLKDVRLGIVSRPAGVRALGSITTVPVASLIDGETFTLDDGVNTPLVFEFDVSGNGVTPGNILVNVAGLVSADQVRDAVVNAVNIEAGDLLITASSGGAATVALQADVGGVDGNQTITDTVADGSFVTTGMVGGIDDSFDFTSGNTLEITYYGLESAPAVVVNVAFTASVLTRQATMDQLNSAIFAALGLPFGAIVVSENRIGLRTLRSGVAILDGSAVQELFDNNEPQTSWDVRSDAVDALGGWRELNPVIDFFSGIDVMQVLEGLQTGFHPSPFLLDFDAGTGLDPSTALVVRDVENDLSFELGDPSFSPEIGIRVQFGARSIGSVRCFFLQPTSIEFDQKSRFSLTTDAGTLKYLPDPTLTTQLIPPLPDGDKPDDGSATGNTTTFASASQDWILEGVKEGDQLIIDFIPILGSAVLADPVVNLAGKTFVYSIDGGPNRTVTFIKDDVSLAPGEVSREGVVDQINASIGENVVSLTGSNRLRIVSNLDFVIRRTGTANDTILNQWQGLPVINLHKFSSFDQDNSSPHAGSYTVASVGTNLTLTSPLPASGDFTDPVTEQQFTVQRVGSQRIGTTAMAVNEGEADLFYFDVELVSEGTGDQYNIDAAQQMTAESYRSDGWYLTTDDSNLTFSPVERPKLVISKTILEQGVDDSPVNATQIAGQNIQITYERSQLTEDVNNFVTSEVERVVCENPLSRHLIPHFVRFDMVYVGGSSEDIVITDTERFIRDLFPQDALEVSDLEKLVSDRGATSINNPIDLIAIVHNVDRTIRAARSQNALTTGRLAAFIPDVLNITRNV